MTLQCRTVNQIVAVQITVGTDLYLVTHMCANSHALSPCWVHDAQCVSCDPVCSAQPMSCLCSPQDSLLKAVGLFKDGRMREEDLRHAYDAVRVANK